MGFISVSLLLIIGGVGILAAVADSASAVGLGVDSDALVNSDAVSGSRDKREVIDDLDPSITLFDRKLRVRRYADPCHKGYYTHKGCYHPLLVFTLIVVMITILIGGIAMGYFMVTSCLKYEKRY